MTKVATVFMFSGQGSQHFQMGRALFDAEPVFRDCMTELDRIVCDLSGKSVIDALYASGQSKSQSFDQTMLTHPAIFMVEYALAQTLIRAGIVPDITLGASLGSYAAATVAGALDARDAVRAIVEQASVLESRCEPGGMLAVLAEPALYDQLLAGDTEMAGVNFASHFVVSARRECFADIETRLRRREVAFQRLPVSFAFHSRWIDPARPTVEACTKSLPRKPARLPFMCCERADAVHTIDDGYFWRVVRNPIRFRDTVARLEQTAPHRYIDVGPGGTLATFLKYGLAADSRSTVHPIMTPYGQDAKNLAALRATVH